MNKETDEIQREYDRLERMPKPARWDRASWFRGAMYALAWIINLRGSSVPPLDAGMMFVRDDSRDAHTFVGRADRWCEICNRPDRDPIHLPPGGKAS